VRFDFQVQMLEQFSMDRGKTNVYVDIVRRTRHGIESNPIKFIPHSTGRRNESVRYMFVMRKNPCDSYCTAELSLKFYFPQDVVDYILGIGSKDKKQPMRKKIRRQQSNH